MSKKHVFAALLTVGVFGFSGAAAAATLPVEPGGTVTVDGGDSVTVTINCTPGLTYTFTLEDSSDDQFCEFPDVGDVHGFVAGEAPPQFVTGTVIAPIEPGTYAGTISSECFECTDGPLGFRTAALRPGMGTGFPRQALPGFTVIVRQVATTSTTTTTTLAPTTTAAASTTIAPTTTAAAAIPPAPTTTTAISGVLPATGSDENDQAVIALVLVALGGGLVLATRYRRRSSAG